VLGRFTCETTITIIAGEVSPVSQPMHNAGRLTAARGRSQCWCSMLVLEYFTAVGEVKCWGVLILRQEE
jgi:hypothetical protein